MSNEISRGILSDNVEVLPVQGQAIAFDSRMTGTIDDVCGMLSPVVLLDSAYVGAMAGIVVESIPAGDGKVYVDYAVGKQPLPSARNVSSIILNYF